MTIRTPVAFLLLFPLPASGQTAVSADTTATCHDCFELIHHLSLGGEDGPGFLDVQTAQVTMDEQGRFWVALMEEIKVFGPDGGFLSTVGRGGQGPGEFRFITGLFTDPDGKIYAFDAQNMRATVLSLEGEPLQSWGVRGRVPEAVFLPNGQIVANVVARTPDLVGLPLHLIDPGTGSVLRSFGAGPTEHFNSRIRTPGWRNLALSSDSTVWSSSRTEYKLTEWNIKSGEKIRELERRVEWFPPNPATVFEDQGIVLPDVEAIRQDGEGKVWVLVRVPAPDWREHMIPTPVPDGRILEMPDQIQNLFETRVEVFDPTAGELLAAQVFPPILWGFLGSDLVYGLTEDGKGVPRVEIWKLRLGGIDPPPARRR